ncbi:MAG: hypothetical protein DMG04_04775 [Acidobacteria bacterium]|nr:MAG: hypothetical protein DMG04_04775 [Acidobacteriota bacterium]
MAGQQRDRRARRAGHYQSESDRRSRLLRLQLRSRRPHRERQAVVLRRNQSAVGQARADRIRCGAERRRLLVRQLRRHDARHDGAVAAAVQLEGELSGAAHHEADRLAVQRGQTSFDHGRSRPAETAAVDDVPAPARSDVERRNAERSAQQPAPRRDLRLRRLSHPLHRAARHTSQSVRISGRHRREGESEQHRVEQQPCVRTERIGAGPAAEPLRAQSDRHVHSFGAAPRRDAPVQDRHDRRLGKRRHESARGQSVRRLSAPIQPRRAVANRRLQLSIRDVDEHAARPGGLCDRHLHVAARDGERRRAMGAVSQFLSRADERGGAVQRDLPGAHLSEAGRAHLGRHGAQSRRRVGPDGQRQDGRQSLVRHLRRHDGRLVLERVQSERPGDANLFVDRPVPGHAVQERHVQRHQLRRHAAVPRDAAVAHAAERHRRDQLGDQSGFETEHDLRIHHEDGARADSERGRQRRLRLSPDSEQLQHQPSVPAAVRHVDSRGGYVRRRPHRQSCDHLHVSRLGSRRRVQRPEGGERSDRSAGHVPQHRSGGHEALFEEMDRRRVVLDDEESPVDHGQQLGRQRKHAAEPQRRSIRGRRHVDVGSAGERHGQLPDGHFVVVFLPRAVGRAGAADAAVLGGFVRAAAGLGDAADGRVRRIHGADRADSRDQGDEEIRARSGPILRVELPGLQRAQRERHHVDQPPDRPTVRIGNGHRLCSSRTLRRRDHVLREERSMRVGIAALFVLIITGWLWHDARAQSGGPVVSGAHRFEKVVDGIYYATASGTMTVGSNSPVIVNDDEAMVVDSEITPAAARALVADLKAVTNKPVGYIVDSHYHYDHAFGNQVFAPAIPVIGHDNTRRRLLGEFGNVMEQYTYLNSVQPVPARLESLKQRIAEEKDPQQKASLERQAANSRAYLEQVKETRVTPPNVTIDKKMTLFRGGREIQILYLGRGHTDTDVVVLLPKERIVCTGDLMESQISYMGDSFPEEWIATLDRLKALNFDTVMPGHGVVFKGTAKIDAFQKYLRDVINQVNASRKQGLSAEEAAKRVDVTAYSGEFPQIRGVGIDAAAARRIYQLAERPE